MNFPTNIGALVEFDLNSIVSTNLNLYKFDAYMDEMRFIQLNLSKLIIFQVWKINPTYDAFLDEI